MTDEPAPRIIHLFFELLLDSACQILPGIVVRVAIDVVRLIDLQGRNLGLLDRRLFAPGLAVGSYILVYQSI